VQGDGTAWAVGGNGVILHYKGNSWAKDAQGSGLADGNTLNSVAVQGDGTAWAMGYGGVILHYKGNSWAKDAQGSGLADGNDLYSVAVQGDGTAWAVGGNGVILKLNLTDREYKDKTVSIEYSNNLKKLKDSIKINFRHPIYQIDSAGFSITKEGENIDSRTQKAFYKITYGENDSTIVIKFQPEAKTYIESLQSGMLQAKLSVGVYPGYYLPQDYKATYPGLNQSPWKQAIQIAVTTGIAIIGLNLLFLLLAIPFPWFRKNGFGDNFNTLLGIFSIKGIITKPLLIWISPVKMAVLGAYKKGLAQRPDLAQWTSKTKTFISPQIGDDITENVVDTLWQTISAAPAKGEGKVLWLLEGRSGLGKTALLEQLASKALNNGKTPLFLKLSTFIQDDGASIQEQFDYYGQLRVDKTTARDLVTGGGFIVLLDGLNEAVNPESVRTFIKAILPDNEVVLTTQYEPDWAEIKKQKIDLRPFGKPQIERSLKNKFNEGSNDNNQNCNDKTELIKEWVDRIYAAEYLFDIETVLNAEDGTAVKELRLLPFTASLITDYIKKTDKIPPNRMAVYRALFVHLEDDLQYINFKNKAWTMFCNNSQDIAPNNPADNISLEFLQKAKKNEVLTEFIIGGAKNFRFRHERIFRFVVTSYLSSQYPAPVFDDLHKQLTKGQEKRYWADVLEFWGELFAEKVNPEGDNVDQYKTFLLDAGKFEPIILNERLFPQWERLCGKIPAIKDLGFENELLRIIAQLRRRG
jgi:hypothetical protein